jgi:hypothetical protein
VFEIQRESIPPGSRNVAKINIGTQQRIERSWVSAGFSLLPFPLAPAGYRKPLQPR